MGMDVPPVILGISLPEKHLFRAVFSTRPPVKSPGTYRKEGRKTGRKNEREGKKEKSEL